MHDRIGRLNHLDKFHVEPEDRVRDPLAGLPAGSGGMGGISGGPVILGIEPFEYSLDLNEWVQFKTPGSYSLKVTTRRVSGLPADFDPTQPFRPYPPSEAVELRSNELTIEIVEASPEWASAQLRTAAAMLDEQGPEEDRESRRRKGARLLRFLGAPQAAREMVRRLGAGPHTPTYGFMLGILGDEDPTAILPYMEERLVASDQAVDSLFVNTLTRVAELARDGRAPPAPPEGPEREAWMERQRERREQFAKAQSDYYERLAAALPTKQGRARAVCASALSSFSSTQPEAPSWSSGVASSLRQSFSELPLMTQRDLLSHRWREIAGPEMIPALEQIYSLEPIHHYRELRNLAVRRLYEVDPRKGRSVIVNQILGPTAGLELETLALLEEHTLPEAFDYFVAHLAQGGYEVGRLVLRYGDESLSEAALAGLRVREESFGRAGQAACVSALHLFALKVAPDSGEEAFKRAIASSIAKSPHCLDRLRHLVPAAYAWSPRLERLLGELQFGAPVIAKISAAELLGRFGSPRAEQSLWKAMEAFHEWWEGREEDLAGPDGSESMLLERSLRKALALGSAWILDEQELARLKALCVSAEGRREVDGWVRDSAEPVPISVSSLDRARFSASIGRFHLHSRDDFLAKLHQFPARVRFRWEYGRVPRVGEPGAEFWREVQGLVPSLRSGN